MATSQDVEPFLKLLEENWYDTVESLRPYGLILGCLGVRFPVYCSEVVGV